MTRLLILVVLLWAATASANPPEFATWQTGMTTYGKKHCDWLKSGAGTADERLNSVYYDGQRVYYQIADFTKDTNWNTCAQAAEKAYRDEYVIKAQGAVPGYYLFPHGLGEDYRRTKDEASKSAVDKPMPPVAVKPGHPKKRCIA